MLNARQYAGAMPLMEQALRRAAAESLGLCEHLVLDCGRLIERLSLAPCVRIPTIAARMTAARARWCVACTTMP